MTHTPKRGWKFWVDRGGTFTDIVARAPNGDTSTLKLLSENAAQYEDAAVEGVRRFLGLNAEDAFPDQAIEHIKMGTTVATNALLERKGDRTVLVTTKGFGDALKIGYQNRPHLFVKNIVLPDVLHECVIEAEERVTALGEVLLPLNEDALRADLQKAYGQGLRSVAIVFMHGYRYGDHERRAAQVAKDIGFAQISISHQVSPLMKLVSRGDTTVVDAYLSPILRRYVDRVVRHVKDAPLMFMQSNGGLTDGQSFQGKDSILSGPAGGVVGMAKTAKQAGFERVIGFDMGGTSTDVSHFDGTFERLFETQISGVRLRAPMMNIHTVAAGGGSILHFDGARFRVGPDSAGAQPGPACYRQGGPLTVTDCNVMLGKIQPAHFPAVFGPHGDQGLDACVVQSKFEALAQDIETKTGRKMSVHQVAQGFLSIAVENMAAAIQKISVERGYDITQYALNCFGGAGGQHACQVADALAIDAILVHPYSGVLSAYGMGLADFAAMREQAVECALTDAGLWTAKELFNALSTEVQDELLDQGLKTSQINCTHKLHVRYDGTDMALAVNNGPLKTVIQDFEAQHKKRFGFSQTGKSLVIEAVSVEATGRTGEDDFGVAAHLPRSGALHPHSKVSMTIDGKVHEAGLYHLTDLQAQDCVKGPAIITDDTSTTVLELGWQAEYTELGNLVLKRFDARPERHALGTQADPVMLEIFNNLFMSIAEQMGAVLANTAHSVNIKERLDFSCAVFDAQGQLVANAPHMPVHLGSMGESVISVMDAHKGAMNVGDVFAVNAPYNGGTHLPDVTLVTPMFGGNGLDILFYVASRGHHADIGGISPGSMPPGSTSVEQEGILIDNLRIVRAGVFEEERVRFVLKDGPWPVRNVDQNIADLNAQIAANEKGVRELANMVSHFGLKVVQAYMQHVQDNAEESVRQALLGLKDGSFRYEMDNGAVIQVRVTIDKKARSATVDFTGTSPQQTNNFNAPCPVSRAAVLYVFRTLVDDDIPLNAGCLKPVHIIVPEGCMLNPKFPAAVVAGNVETSQCVTDALYGAMGVMAGAQGTMNNFTFGNDTYQYYETICGGAGAGPDFEGQSAVHTHMTNSRLTDAEILELRFPVLIEAFAIRKGSGGQGLHSGGDGVVRRVRFLKSMKAAILSNHRRIAPFGLAGGGCGKTGSNRVERKDGRVEDVGSTASVSLNAGDVFVIQTPGGGGYGDR